MFQGCTAELQGGICHTTWDRWDLLIGVVGSRMNTLWPATHSGSKNLSNESTLPLGHFWWKITAVALGKGNTALELRLKGEPHFHLHQLPAGTLAWHVALSHNSLKAFSGFHSGVFQGSYNLRIWGNRVWNSAGFQWVNILCNRVNKWAILLDMALSFNSIIHMLSKTAWTLLLVMVTSPSRESLGYGYTHIHCPFSPDPSVALGEFCLQVHCLSDL